MSTPPPRPALRRAPDAGLSPAAVAQAPVPPASPGWAAGSTPTAVAPGTKGKGGKKGKKGKGGKPATLRAEVPRDLRDRLDERAAELGYSRDDVLALIIRAWLDG